MDDLDSRLESCLCTVASKDLITKVRSTPNQPIEELSSVEWVTVFTLIEEEFGIDMEYENLDRLTSYAALREYIQQRT